MLFRLARPSSLRSQNYVPRRTQPGRFASQQVEVQEKPQQRDKSVDREVDRPSSRRDFSRQVSSRPRGGFGALDRFMDDFFVGPWDPFTGFDRSIRRALKEGMRDLERVAPEFDWSPSADLSETTDAYVIKANLPGVPKENMKIEVDHNMITLRGERKDEHEEKNEDTRFHKRESVYGTFMRRFTLPEDIDPKKIKATYKDGVLSLNIPKSEETQAVQIPIVEEESSQKTNGS
jgi:HSP20 family protein